MKTVNVVGSLIAMFLMLYSVPDIQSSTPARSRSAEQTISRVNGYPASNGLPANSENDSWRRTVNGWEQRHEWIRPRQVDIHSWLRIETLHPLTWAAFQCWVSIGALILLEPSRRLTSANR